MSAGILVCGLNGAGKSTIGRALAEALGYEFIDSEELYFPQAGALLASSSQVVQSARYPYSDPKNYDEAKAELLRRASLNPNFVLASVKGDFGAELFPLLSCAVFVSIPESVRAERVFSRSYRKFGSRMLIGGDLFAEEQSFIKMALSRTEGSITEYLQSLAVPVIRVSGLANMEENVADILAELRGLRL